MRAMPKKKSKFDRYTWIITELVLGIAALGYGLFGKIMTPTSYNYIYIILVCLGSILLLVAIFQLTTMRKKKISKFCSKCGEKIKKEDDFCPKCGEKIG
jgi:ribosomal protein S27AE